MNELELIITTLNRVEVRGQENLSRLLGCLQALERMKEASAHDGHDQQG